MGQANVWRWVPDILPLLIDGDPLGVDDFATHRACSRSAAGVHELPREEGGHRQGAAQARRPGGRSGHVGPRSAAGCEAQHAVEVGVRPALRSIQPVAQRHELVVPRIPRLQRRRPEPVSFPQCGRPPASPAMASSAANQSPGSFRGHVRGDVDGVLAGRGRAARRPPRPSGTSTGKAARQSLAPCAHRCSSVRTATASARGTAYSISRNRTRAGSRRRGARGRSRFAGRAPWPTCGASGGTRPGTRRPAATTPANAALARTSSSHTARQRGSGASPSSSGTLVLTSAASRRCAGTSRTRRDRSRSSARSPPAPP